MQKRPPPPPPPPAARLRGIPRRPPPPPPPAARRGAPPPPAPSSSTRAKIELSKNALSLRDEQLAARVRYYGDDQATNAELDAITEAVVAELSALRMVAQPRESAVPDVEIELMSSLRQLLEKLFSPSRTGFLQRKIREVQRRITQLFFHSELYAELAHEGGDARQAEWPEQALFYVLTQHEAQLVEDLKAIPVSRQEVTDQALERLSGFTKQLRSDFLSRTTPELERLLKIYGEVLTEFFYTQFPTMLGEFCWAVVRESQVARGHQLGYKLTEDKFQAFRSAFDRNFLEHLILNVQEPIAKRAADGEDTFRDATLRFVNDPEIHSSICAAINDAIYDYLHGEGYLDLPTRWRAMLRDR